MTNTPSITPDGREWIPLGEAVSFTLEHETAVAGDDYLTRIVSTGATRTFAVNLSDSALETLFGTGPVDPPFRAVLVEYREEWSRPIPPLRPSLWPRLLRRRSYRKAWRRYLRDLSAWLDTTPDADGVRWRDARLYVPRAQIEVAR